MFKYKKKIKNNYSLPPNAIEPKPTTVQRKVCPVSIIQPVRLNDQQNRVKNSNNNSKEPMVVLFENENYRTSSSEDNRHIFRPTGIIAGPKYKLTRTSSSEDNCLTGIIAGSKYKLTRTPKSYYLPGNEIKDNHHQSPKSEHQTLHQSPKTGHQMFPQSPKMEHQRRYQFLNREHQTIPSNESETNSISNVENLDSKEILRKLDLLEQNMQQSFTFIIKRFQQVKDRQMNVYKYSDEVNCLLLKNKINVRDVSIQCFIKKKPPVTIIPSNSHEKYKKKTKTPKKQLKEPKNLASWSSSVKKPPYNKSYNNKDSNYHFNEEITSSNTEVSHNEYSYLKKCGRSRNSNVRVRHNTRNDAENSEQFQEDEDKTDEDDVDEDDYSFSHVD